MPNLTWLFVAVVYAIAIALARKIPWRVALLFYVLVLIFFFPVLTQDYVNLSTDVLKGMPPWAYLHPGDWEPRHGELNDLPLQIVPWAHQVRESWKSLTIPLWNAASGCGYPLLANGQSSGFSFVRLVALPLSLGHAMAAEGAMKILIAMSFMYLYCRRRYSEIGSVVAAVSFGFSGFLVSWLSFPIVTAACFAPAVLYCIDLLAERATYRRFLLAVAIAVAIVFAGHPETAAHLALLSIGYVLWMIFLECGNASCRSPSPSQSGDWRRRTPNKRLLLALAGVVGVAVLLAAPYLAVVAEAVPKSFRYQKLKTEPLSRILGYGDWRCAVMLLQPYFFGRAPVEPVWAPSQTEPLGGYAGAFAIAAWLATFIDVIARRRFRSLEFFFALATLAAVGVMFNWPGISHAIHALLPMMAHARVRLIFALLISIQTAAALDVARRKPALIGIAIVSALLLVLLQRVPFPDRYWRAVAVLTMMPSVVVLALAAIAILTRNRIVLLALVAAVAVELFLDGHNRNPPISSEYMYARTPLIDKLHELQRQTPPNAPFRIAGTGAVIFPNSNAVLGFEDIRVHDPMANARYIEFMQLVGGLDTTSYHFWWEKNIELSSLDFLNVRYVVGYENTVMHDTSRFQLVWKGVDGTIYENRSVMPRFYAVRNVVAVFDPIFFRARLRDFNDWSQTALIDRLELESPRMHDDFFLPRPPGSPLAKATIVEAKPSEYRLHVSAPRWSLVVGSIPWWPGWRVTRNGKRAEPIRVNGAFLGFAVPPGETDVRVWYAPTSFRAGAAVSLLTLAALVTAGLRRLRRGAPE